MKSRKKWPHLKKKVLFHQENALCHILIKTTAKLHELGYELLLHPPYSLDLASSDFFLFADLKKMLAGKKFSANEEVIAETEAYFDAMLKSYFKMVSKKCMITIIVVSPYVSLRTFQLNFLIFSPVKSNRKSGSIQDKFNYN
jgi:hypothetical protein